MSGRCRAKNEESNRYINFIALLCFFWNHSNRLSAVINLWQFALKRKLFSISYWARGNRISKNFRFTIPLKNFNSFICHMNNGQQLESDAKKMRFYRYFMRQLEIYLFVIDSVLLAHSLIYLFRESSFLLFNASKILIV